MQFRKIFGPARLDGSTTGTDYPLPPMAGGKSFKVANYMVKVVATSDSANCKIALALKHGPDGTVWAVHSAAIASTATGTAPSVLSGDADTSKIIGEFRQPIVTVLGIGGPHWAVVEIFEITKPF